MSEVRGSVVLCVCVCVCVCVCARAKVKSPQRAHAEHRRNRTRSDGARPSHPGVERAVEDKILDPKSVLDVRSRVGLCF